MLIMGVGTLNRLKVLFAVAAVAGTAWAAGPEFDRALKLYHSTNFHQSIQVLQSIPSKDGAVYGLLGQNYYMDGDFKKATDSLEKALQLEPANAQYALWLGRAFGRRAELASPFTAPGYANKARQYFELSVNLNPRDVDALSDLFEYYLEAPGFLGGGADRAEATAQKASKINPIEGLAMEARLAEHRKEYSHAEQQLRHAIEIAPQQIGRFVDLARFLVRRGRVAEADQVLARAEQAAPNNPRLMFATAEIYVKSHRNLDVARDLLKRYMSASTTADDPPKADAAKLLHQAGG